MTFDEKKVISGTWGELWVDNEYMAEITGFKAEVEPKFEDVPKARKLATGKKLTGIEPSGEFKFHKVNSKYSKMVSDNLKRGKATVVKLISNLDDPDSDGNERIVVYDALLGKVTLADWELQKLGEVTVPFTYTEWDFEDVI